MIDYDTLPRVIAASNYLDKVHHIQTDARNQMFIRTKTYVETVFGRLDMALELSKKKRPSLSKFADIIKSKTKSLRRRLRDLSRYYLMTHDDIDKVFKQRLVEAGGEASELIRDTPTIQADDIGSIEADATHPNYAAAAALRKALFGHTAGSKRKRDDTVSDTSADVDPATDEQKHGAEGGGGALPGEGSNKRRLIG